MIDPTKPIHIDPTGIYDNAALVLTLGLTHEAIGRARRGGLLRHIRNGHRILYRGSWIIEWLESEAQPRPDNGGRS